MTSAPCPCGTDCPGLIQRRLRQHQGSCARGIAYSSKSSTSRVGESDELRLILRRRRRLHEDRRRILLRRDGDVAELDGLSVLGDGGIADEQQKQHDDDQGSAHEMGHTYPPDLVGQQSEYGPGGRNARFRCDREDDLSRTIYISCRQRACRLAAGCNPMPSGASTRARARARVRTMPVSLSTDTVKPPPAHLGPRRLEGSRRPLVSYLGMSRTCPRGRSPPAVTCAGVVAHAGGGWAEVPGSDWRRRGAGGKHGHETDRSIEVRSSVMRDLIVRLPVFGGGGEPPAGTCRWRAPARP